MKKKTIFSALLVSAIFVTSSIAYFTDRTVTVRNDKAGTLCVEDVSNGLDLTNLTPLNEVPVEFKTKHIGTIPAEMRYRVKFVDTNYEETQSNILTDEYFIANVEYYYDDSIGLPANISTGKISDPVPIEYVMRYKSVDENPSLAYDMSNVMSMVVSGYGLANTSSEELVRHHHQRAVTEENDYPSIELRNMSYRDSEIEDSYVDVTGSTDEKMSVFDIPYYVKKTSDGKGKLILDTMYDDYMEIDYYDNYSDALNMIVESKMGSGAILMNEIPRSIELDIDYERLNDYYTVTEGDAMLNAVKTIISSPLAFMNGYDAVLELTKLETGHEDSLSVSELNNNAYRAAKEFLNSLNDDSKSDDWIDLGVVNPGEIVDSTVYLELLNLASEKAKSNDNGGVIEDRSAPIDALPYSTSEMTRKPFEVRYELQARQVIPGMDSEEAWQTVSTISVDDEGNIYEGVSRCLNEDLNNNSIEISYHEEESDNFSGASNDMHSEQAIDNVLNNNSSTEKSLVSSASAIHNPLMYPKMSFLENMSTKYTNAKTKNKYIKIHSSEKIDNVTLKDFEVKEARASWAYTDDRYEWDDMYPQIKEDHDEQIKKAYEAALNAVTVDGNTAEIRFNLTHGPEEILTRYIEEIGLEYIFPDGLDIDAVYSVIEAETSGVAVYEVETAGVKRLVRVPISNVLYVSTGSGWPT